MGNNPAGHWLQGAAETVEHGVENVAEDIGHGVVNVADSVADIATKVGHGIEDVAEEAGHGIEYAAEEAWKGIKLVAPVALAIAERFTPVGMIIAHFMPQQETQEDGEEIPKPPSLADISPDRAVRVFNALMKEEISHLSKTEPVDIPTLAKEACAMMIKFSAPQTMINADFLAKGIASWRKGPPAGVYRPPPAPPPAQQQAYQVKALAGENAKALTTITYWVKNGTQPIRTMPSWALLTPPQKTSMKSLFMKLHGFPLN